MIQGRSCGWCSALSGLGLLLVTLLIPQPARALVEGSVGPLLGQGLDRYTDVYVDVRSVGETIQLCTSDEGLLDDGTEDPSFARAGEEILVMRPSAAACDADGECSNGEVCRDWDTGLSSPLDAGYCVTALHVAPGAGLCTDEVYAWLSHKATEVGAYRIDFAGETEVMPNGLDSPNTRFWAVRVLDPTNAENAFGRVHTDFWWFNSHTFTGNPTSADFYALVPSGGTGNYVFVIDFERMNGYIYQIFANALGNYDTPSRSWCQHGDPLNAVCSERAAERPTHRLVPEYQIYLNYPDGVENPEVTPQITAFSFNDEVGSSSLSPNGDGRQDLGTFSFSASVPGTYRIIVDTDKDGVFDSSKDLLIAGSALRGANTTTWNGTGSDGRPLPAGDYGVQLSLSVGETHFPMIDIEDNSSGLLIRQALGPSNLVPRTTYWDDTAVGGLSNLPAGSNQPHAWMYNPSNPDLGVGGNLMAMDTWVTGEVTTTASFQCGQCSESEDHVTIGTPGDDEEAPVDTDGDGIPDDAEIRDGTDPNDPDSDDDGVNDGDERENGTDPNDPDSDDDGLNDGAEALYGTDPNDPDTDDGGARDGVEDSDQDGVRDTGETNALDPSDDSLAGQAAVTQDCGCRTTGSAGPGGAAGALLLLLGLVALRRR